jgi:hypothetical protein
LLKARFGPVGYPQPFSIQYLSSPYERKLEFCDRTNGVLIGLTAGAVRMLDLRLQASLFQIHRCRVTTSSSTIIPRSFDWRCKTDIGGCHTKLHIKRAYSLSSGRLFLELPCLTFDCSTRGSFFDISLIIKNIIQTHQICIRSTKHGSAIEHSGQWVFLGDRFKIGLEKTFGKSTVFRAICSAAFGDLSVGGELTFARGRYELRAGVCHRGALETQLTLNSDYSLGAAVRGGFAGVGGRAGLNIRHLRSWNWQPRCFVEVSWDVEASRLLFPW